MTMDEHAGGRVLAAGATLDEASAAVILLHGRGAGAADILSLAPSLERGDLAYLAPQAARSTWYPQSFLAPLEANEPALGSALARIAELVDEVAAAGVERRRIALLGFSQGACLALESAARLRRIGGVVALTGGLIGPPETPSEHWLSLARADGEPRPLAGMPIFLGSGDPDPHVPWRRVEQSAEVLRELGAELTLRRYEGIPHAVVEDELEHARRLLAKVAPSS